MKLKLTLTTAIVGAALALPGSAWAQAPPNDTFEQATVISSLPVLAGARHDPGDNRLDRRRSVGGLRPPPVPPRLRCRNGLVRVHAARRSESLHLDEWLQLQHRCGCADRVTRQPFGGHLLPL